MPAAHPPPSPSLAAVIAAGGAGTRAGQPCPKQFAAWRGQPVLRHSVAALAEAGVAPIIVVIPAGAEPRAAEALAGIAGVRMITGGVTRQDSVRRGLEALVAEAPTRVLIHDAARPIIPRAVIDRLVAALDDYPGAIPVLPVVDSLCHAEPREGMALTGAMMGAMMGDSAPREALRRVQTPQAFRFLAILAAHRGWPGATTAGDDAQVARAAGLDVALVSGDEALRKLTFARDFTEEAHMATPDDPRPMIRVGTGFDVHALAAGEELWLCGVRIESAMGLAGHSDADVAIHAGVDAILGAIAADDIGAHFSPHDPRWRGASSDRFLAHAIALAHEAGYRLGNLDITIICEAPKIGPHRAAMRARLAAIAGVPVSAISVKATTTERLGFAGRGEGIAAQAVASLIRG